MKCPLLPDKNYGPQLERHMSTGDCVGEECAWWDPRHNMCGLVTFINILAGISRTLKGINDKIPPDEG